MSQTWIQSAWHVAGPVADTLLGVSGVLVAGAAVIFVGMMLLLAASVRRRPSAVRARLWVLGGGVAFPVVVLIGLFVYSEWHKPPWRVAPPKDALIVGVTARMWWWEIRYRDPSTGAEIVTANEIHIPTGRPVYFGLSSGDVIHSFWIPALAGKMDAVPGRVQHLQVQADRAGVWRGQCAEYCGAQHALMAMHVVAHEPADFDAWLAAQSRPASAPRTAEFDRGREAFLSNRCGACHTVRGVSEESRLGPDLTHLGSRLYLGAGTVPNDGAQRIAWLEHIQQLKPGARMPSSGDRIDPATLQSIAAWLGALQ